MIRVEKVYAEQNLDLIANSIKIIPENTEVSSISKNSKTEINTLN